MGRLRLCGHKSRRPQLHGSFRRQPLVRKPLFLLRSPGGSAGQQDFGVWVRTIFYCHIGGSPLPAMICETGRPASGHTGEDQQRPSYGSFAFRAFWIVSGATLLIFLMFFSQGFIRLSESGQRLVGIFVYSASIALPSMLLVTFLSVSYTERFPRMIYAIQAAAFGCTASAGCRVGDLIPRVDRNSTRVNSSHRCTSYAVFS